MTCSLPLSDVSVEQAAAHLACVAVLRRDPLVKQAEDAPWLAAIKSFAKDPRGFAANGLVGSNGMEAIRNALLGAGAGAGVGALASQFQDPKRRRTGSNALTGALIGGLGAGGLTLAGRAGAEAMQPTPDQVAETTAQTQRDLAKGQGMAGVGATAPASEPTTSEPQPVPTTVAEAKARAQAKLDAKPQPAPTGVPDIDKRVGAAQAHLHDAGDLAWRGHPIDATTELVNAGHNIVPRAGGAALGAGLGYGTGRLANAGIDRMTARKRILDMPADEFHRVTKMDLQPIRAHADQQNIFRKAMGRWPSYNQTQLDGVDRFSAGAANRAAIAAEDAARSPTGIGRRPSFRRRWVPRLGGLAGTIIGANAPEIYETLRQQYQDRFR